MTKVTCENCNVEIDVPEGYNAPYIQCPECASIQKFIRNTQGEPRFKILNNKGRERTINQAAPPKQEEKPNQNPAQAPKVKIQQQSQRIEHNIVSKPLDQKQIILDSIGKEGLLKAYKLAGDYLWSTSEKMREKGRAKAIRKLMKERYPLEIASKAIEIAERAPESLKYAKQKLITIIVIIALTIVGCISALLAIL